MTEPNDRSHLYPGRPRCPGRRSEIALSAAGERATPQRSLLRSQRGEILGIGGLAARGKRAASLLVGARNSHEGPDLDRWNGGEVRSPADAIKARPAIALVRRDRKTERTDAADCPGKTISRSRAPQDQQGRVVRRRREISLVANVPSDAKSGSQ